MSERDFLPSNEEIPEHPLVAVPQTATPDIRLEQTNILPSIADILQQAGINTLGEVASKTRGELLQLDGMGVTKLNRLENMLDNYGLELKTTHKVHAEDAAVGGETAKSIRDWLLLRNRLSPRILGSLDKTGYTSVSQLEQVSRRDLIEVHKIVPWHATMISKVMSEIGHPMVKGGWATTAEKLQSKSRRYPPERKSHNRSRNVFKDVIPADIRMMLREHGINTIAKLLKKPRRDYEVLIGRGPTDRMIRALDAAHIELPSAPMGRPRTAVPQQLPVSGGPEIRLEQLGLTPLMVNRLHKLGIVTLGDVAQHPASEINKTVSGRAVKTINQALNKYNIQRVWKDAHGKVHRPGDGSLHWTQLPENRERMKRQVAKATATRAAQQRAKRQPKIASDIAAVLQPLDIETTTEKEQTANGIEREQLGYIVGYAHGYIKTWLHQYCESTGDKISFTDIAKRLGELLSYEESR